MMRKQNSTFKTAFLSEAGSGLENHDYFAFVELEEYACYVLADGLNDLPDAESARLATQTIILAFQEHPSIKKRAISSYLEKANRTLAGANSREHLKASVTVLVTNYEYARYGFAGNTRLRLYRDGLVREETTDMSLGTELVKKDRLPDDVLSRHEQRNNLYTYLGQGRGFKPFVSKKIHLKDGDLFALYSRGIWENLDGGELDDVFGEAMDDPQSCLDNAEDLLLSRQPKVLENYTLAAVFVNKVFQDPNRKRRIKKILTVTIIVFVIALATALAVWLVLRQRKKLSEELGRRYANTIEYIQDDNFLRAGEECKEALGLAEKLRDKKRVQDISDYQKLIEALGTAEDAFGKGEYETARDSYLTARERSRYADRIADSYIEKRLQTIADYLSVFDYIQLGDTLVSQGDYRRAEEKYLQARSLATRVHFEEGRKDALDCLEALYTSRGQAEEEDVQEAKEKALAETGAAQLTSEGDKAFAQGDYEGAKTYYTMALEKYQELGDDVHAGMIQSKMDSSGQKSAENKAKEQQAEDYVLAGKQQEAAGDKLEAKKQYLFAKNLYRELKLDDKVIEVDGLLEVLDTAMEQEKEQKEEMGNEGEEKSPETRNPETEDGHSIESGKPAESAHPVETGAVPVYPAEPESAGGVEGAGMGSVQPAEPVEIGPGW